VIMHTFLRKRMEWFLFSDS